MMVARCWLLLSLLASVAPSQELRLTLGTTYADRVQTADARADVSGLTPEIAQRLGRAQRFLLQTKIAGPYSFDLRSHHFDAFLIVRDDTGALVASADEGGFGTHAALAALELDGGATYSVDACAPRDQVGEFTLLVRAGAAEILSRTEEVEARLEDARERIFAIERRDGYVAPALADACEAQGSLFARNGRQREARASFERALGIREEFFGQSSVEAARTSLRIAGTYAREGDLETARGHYEAAAELLEEAEGEDSVAALRARLACAEAGTGLCDPSALERLRDLVKRAEKSGVDALVRAARAALGRELAARGQLDEATLLLADATSHVGATAGPPAADGNDAGLVAARAEDVELYAELLRTQGRAEESEAVLALRLARLESDLGRDHPATVGLLEALGDARLELERHEDAFAAYERAWLVREALDGAGHPRLARAANGAAAALAASGQLEAAAAQLEVYLAGRTEPTLGERPGRLRAFANLARIELALGETRAAAERLEAVRSTWIARAGDRTPDALDLAVDTALVALSADDDEAAWWNARAALDVAGAHLADDLWALSPDDRIVMAEIVQRGLDALDTVLPRVSRPERDLFAYRSWLTWRARFRPRLLLSESVFTAGRTTEQWIHLLRYRGLAAQYDALLHTAHAPDLALHVEQLADLQRRSSYLKWEYEILDGPPRSQPVPDVLKIVDALPAGAALVDLATYRPWNPAVLVDGELQAPAGWGRARLRAWVLRAGTPDVERFELGTHSAPDAEASSKLREALAPFQRVYLCPEEERDDELDLLVPSAVHAALPPGAAVRLLPDPTFLAGVVERGSSVEGARGLGTLGAPRAAVELHAQVAAEDGSKPEAWILWLPELRRNVSGLATDRWRTMRRANAGLVRAAPRDRLRPGHARGTVFPPLTEAPPGLAKYAPLEQPRLGSVGTLVVRDAWPAILRALHEAGASSVLVAPAEASDELLLEVLRAIWVDGATPTEAATAAGWWMSGR